jgi:hypothetical protein
LEPRLLAAVARRADLSADALLGKLEALLEDATDALATAKKTGELRVVAGLVKSATDVVVRLAQARHGLFSPPSAQTLNIEKLTIASLAHATVPELLRLAGERVDTGDVIDAEVVEHPRLPTQQETEPAQPPEPPASELERGAEWTPGMDTSTNGLPSDPADESPGDAPPASTGALRVEPIVETSYPGRAVAENRSPVTPEEP